MTRTIEMTYQRIVSSAEDHRLFCVPRHVGSSLQEEYVHRLVHRRPLATTGRYLMEASEFV